MIAGVNLKSSAALYAVLRRSKYFVDKTRILSEFIPCFSTNTMYICVTRPRRFGKSAIAQMLSAYLCKNVDTGGLFEQLAVAETPFYKEHLNRHNVVYMDLSKMPDGCVSYGMFKDTLVSRLAAGLKKQCPDAFLDEYSIIDNHSSIWDLFLAVYLSEGEPFVFIIDEWDALFQMDFITDHDKKDYLDFLRSLLKDQPYVEFAYMTGILPIAGASSGSALNMFFEYNMAKSLRFSDYFGFTQTEVDMQFKKYAASCMAAGVEQHVALRDMRKWYNGYTSEYGELVYNPRSVVGALSNNELASYWTRTGPMDEAFYYIRNNIRELRNDFVKLTADGTVSANIQEYAATQMNLGSRDEILSAMIVYGFLTFEIDAGFIKGSPRRILRIPNYEIRLQFEQALAKKEMGYVSRLALASERMLEATLAGDTETMEVILTAAHDTEVSSLRYNDEGDLAALVNLIYLAARNQYEPRREADAGAGRADVIYYPYDHTAPGFIIELKADDTPENAVQQIIDRRYARRFFGDMSVYSAISGRGDYTGKVLAVGMAYDRRTKTHRCKVVELERKQ